MSSNRGRRVGSSPKERSYPFKIAAKMVRSVKSISQDEANQLVIDTRYFYDKFNDQCAEIRELKEQLKLSENTVRMLQVSDDT